MLGVGGLGHLGVQRAAFMGIENVAQQLPEALGAFQDARRVVGDVPQSPPQLEVGVAGLLFELAAQRVEHGLQWLDGPLELGRGAAVSPRG